MATSTATPLNETRRRVVLVDFDWQDADLIPELLARPGISVRLVAGSDTDDAGVRLAELCGLPRTVDLADLTREIFDLALVSERSPRRTQIEGLLLALGTPSLTPQLFMANESGADTTPAVEAPLELHAAALETALGGESFDAVVEQALPDVSDDAPTAPQPVVPNGEPRFVIPSLEEFPSLADREGLEGALRALMSGTGAERAEIHVDDPTIGGLLVEVGPADPLLRGLVEMAQTLGTPQVVTSVAAPGDGIAWGAWPFRTATHRGVLAAAGISPAAGWSLWQKMVEELRSTWDQQDRAQAAPAFPMVPAASAGMLDEIGFRTSIELAVERNRRDGLRFTLHRLTFAGEAAATDLVAQRLPQQLRGTDALYRPVPSRLLLLTAMPAENYHHVRGRVLRLWESAWIETGSAPPAPGIGEDEAVLGEIEDGEAFLSRAGEWMDAKS
jgi:hypothetical protein